MKKIKLWIYSLLSKVLKRPPEEVIWAISERTGVSPERLLSGKRYGNLTVVKARQRLVIELIYKTELSKKEVARVMNRNVNYVHYTLSKYDARRINK